MVLVTTRQTGNRFSGIKKTVYFYAVEKGGYYATFKKDTELKLLRYWKRYFKSLWIIKIIFS